MSILKLRGMLPALVAAAGLAIALPGSAQAQGGVNLVPWAGAYIPTRNSFEDLDNAAFDRDISVIGGARLTFWGTGILGFEATGGYSPARVGGETINERNTNLFAASGRLLLALSPVTNPVGFYIGAGPALLTRGRSVFNEDRSRTDFGGTAGLGFQFALGESGRSGHPARPRGLLLQRRLRRRRRVPERHRGFAGPLHRPGRAGRLQRTLSAAAKA